MELELGPIPNLEWSRRYEEVLKDPFLSSKYNRERRIRDKIEYLREFIPELEFFTKGKVLDLGPGPGEFLEICRARGFDTYGIDSCLGECEMGEPYLLLSQLMSERQKLGMNYEGVDHLIKTKGLPFEPGGFVLVNSQGSIEQILKDYTLEGASGELNGKIIPTWRVGLEFERVIKKLLSETHRILCNDGLLVIYGNGSRNQDYYHSVLIQSAEEQDLKLLKTSGGRFHKFRKGR